MLLPDPHLILIGLLLTGGSPLSPSTQQTQRGTRWTGGGRTPGSYLYMEELREPRLRDCCALGLLASSSALPMVGGIGASRYIPAISSGGSYGSCGPAKDTQTANGGAPASLCPESHSAAWSPTKPSAQQRFLSDLEGRRESRSTHRCETASAAG
jgi:hypothetical protein